METPRPNQGWRWMQRLKQEWAHRTFPPQHNTTQPHLPTTTAHSTSRSGRRATAHLPLFSQKKLESAHQSLLAGCPFPIVPSWPSLLGRLNKMRAPGALPSGLSPIKTGLPSFSATLTSTDTLPTITEYRRTRTEESVKRVAPVPDMASGPCCCEPGMVNGRRRTQR